MNEGEFLHQEYLESDKLSNYSVPPFWPVVGPERPKKKKVMSQQEYVNKGGLVCPHCKSGNVFVDGRLYDYEEGAHQKVECGSCGSRWNDVYKLVGWEPEYK